MSEDVWARAAAAMTSAGPVPMPVTGTLLELLRTILSEEEAAFIPTFTKPTLNLDEIRERCGLDGASLEAMLDGLLHKGALMVSTSRGTGMAVYRLMPPFPGLFEYTAGRDGREGEAARGPLRPALFGTDADDPGPLRQRRPRPAGRAPHNPRGPGGLRYEDAMRIIEKFSTFAVGHCYCRHHKELLGKPCRTTDEKENCLTFGRSARFVIDYGFGREISREEAGRILKECEEAGLVHKFFHERDDLARDEYAICNCCKCCCATFDTYYRGMAPMSTYASHRAAVDGELCNGCGECVERCPMEAVELAAGTAGVDGGRCIGCGVSLPERGHLPGADRHPEGLRPPSAQEVRPL